jgi:Protein of unknown function (DUF3306)
MAERRDENFLARWSRRKQAARAAERAEEAQPSTPTRAADTGVSERADAPDGAPALPDPATLDASSDFSAFLGRDVPIETHRAALRRLWRLDPFYNRLDGLSDYAEDFTDPARVARGLRTAYKVGRGMLEQTGDAAAHPDEVRGMQLPGDDSQRIATSSAEPVPPEKPEPGTPLPAEVAPPTSEPHRPEPRRPRPLPRRR